MVLASYIKKYFWGDNLSEMEWSKHKNYIIQTLLNKGDEKSLRWLFTKISKSELKKTLPILKLEPKSKNFWQIFLS